jgi:hypothetical protein
MAITTVNDKLAIMEFGQIWEPGLPISPSTLGQDDQQQLLHGYPSVLWGAYIAPASSSSGIHRLSAARAIERQNQAKKAYHSIDWSSPVFGDTPTPDVSVAVVVPETPSVEPKLLPVSHKEQEQLSDIDREIQSLMRDVIAQEGTVAELQAIEQSIQDTEKRGLEAELLYKKRRIALLLLLSAA